MLLLLCCFTFNVIQVAAPLLLLLMVHACYRYSFLPSSFRVAVLSVFMLLNSTYYLLSSSNAALAVSPNAAHTVYTAAPNLPNYTNFCSVLF